MTDTPPDIEDAYTAMFARLTGEERLRMVSDMFETARALVIADIRARDPDILPAELRARLFTRLYADDLDERTFAAALTALKASSG
jgi:hypothetical protein